MVADSEEKRPPDGGLDTAQFVFRNLVCDVI
jgi:hypothetical protein